MKKIISIIMLSVSVLLFSSTAYASDTYSDSPSSVSISLSAENDYYYIVSVPATTGFEMIRKNMNGILVENEDTNSTYYSIVSAFAKGNIPDNKKLLYSVNTSNMHSGDTNVSVNMFDFDKFMGLVSPYITDEDNDNMNNIAMKYISAAGTNDRLAIYNALLNVYLDYDVLQILKRAASEYAETELSADYISYNNLKVKNGTYFQSNVSVSETGYLPIGYKAIRATFPKDGVYTGELTFDFMVVDSDFDISNLNNR